MIGHKVTKNVEIHNDTGLVYVSGDGETEGSKRHAIDEDTGYEQIQVLEDGIFQPGPLELSNNTLFVGKNASIGGAGHHIITKSGDGHVHFLAHNEVDPITVLATTDTQIPYPFASYTNVEVQPDDTGLWSGTTFAFPSTPPASLLSRKLHLKTGATAATSLVRIRVYQGTDDTGVLIFDQKYPQSLFTANSTISLDLRGYLEFDFGKDYYFKYESDETFSLKTNVGVTKPYYAVDYSLIREDNILQTKPWVSGDTWTLGDYFIDSRKIYVCNVTGVQTGTFASNSTKWNEIGNESEDLWHRVGNYKIELTSDDDVLNVKQVKGPAAQDLLLDTTDGDKFVRMQANTAIEDFFVTTDLTWLGAPAYNSVPTKALRVTGDVLFDGYSNSNVSLDVNGLVITSGTGFVSNFDNLGFRIYDALQPRFAVMAGQTIMASSLNGWNANVTNSGVLIGNGVTQHFHASSSLTGLYSPDASVNLVLTNTLAQIVAPTIDLNDGVRGRVTIDATDSSLVSPDGLKNVVVNNIGIGITGGTFGVAATLAQITTPTFNVIDATRTRISANATDSRIVSPDGQGIFVTDNTGSYIISHQASVFDATTSLTKLYCPDNQFTLTLTNSAITLNDGVRDRIVADTLDSGFVSPDGLNHVLSNNGGITLTSGTNSQLLVHPSWIRSTAITHYVHDGTRDRLLINPSMTTITAPNGGNVLAITDSSILIYDGGLNRFEVDATTSELLSPNGLCKAMVSNTASTLTANTSQLIVGNATLDFNDGTEDRINITNIHSKLFSPDANLNVGVSNSKVMLTGDTDIIGSAIISDALTVGTAGTTTPAHYTYLILARWTGGHNASTGLQFQGGSTASGFRPDWQMDNFYGNLRMFLNSSESYEIQMQNVGTGDMLLHVDGNIAAIGNDGFTSAGHTAEIMLGDANNFIRATNNNMMLIDSPLGIKFSDWTKTDYLMLSAGKIIMAQLPTSDPSVEGELWNSSGTVKVSAG